MEVTNRVYERRILGYIPLHYGKSYLKEAIQSLSPWVEKIIVLYTQNPSFGHGTTASCPEGREELKAIVESASSKVEWVDTNVGQEGEHRGIIFSYAEGYDGILTVDSDEVLEYNDMAHALKLCWETDKRNIGFGGYVNFWKSFNYACYDGFTPIRFINLHNGSGQGVVPVRVYHFGYAQPDSVMKYKLLIHGHFDEIRPNWYEDIYKAWAPENNFNDLHLTSFGLWNATPYDRFTLPQCLLDHPFFDKEFIE